MFGQLCREHEPDSRLNVPRFESLFLSILDKLGCFSGNPFEIIMDEGVHDVQGLLGDCEIREDFLEDLIDVHRKGLYSSSSALSTSQRFPLIDLR